MAKYFFFDDCSQAGVEGIVYEYNVVIQPDEEHPWEYTYFVLEDHYYEDPPGKVDGPYGTIIKGPLNNKFISNKVVYRKNFQPDLQTYSERNYVWIINEVTKLSKK